MAKITKFYFDKASYLIGDEQSQALLMIDYKNNKYRCFGKLRKEVGKIARDLLQRKHGVNFADRIEKR